MRARTNFYTAILASGLLVLAGCGTAESEVKAAGAVPVQIARVEEVTVDTGTHYSATIEPDTTVEMTFKVDGYVESLFKVGGHNLQNGDFVPKGAVLARVRQSDYRANLDAASAQVLQAEEGVQVSAWKLSQAQAIYTKASLDAERATALYAEKALTKQDYDAARAQFDSTRAEVEAVSRSIDAQRELLATAQANKRSSTITFEDTALVSPISAVVLHKGVEVGNLVSRAASVFRLGDVSTVRMAFSVPDTLVAGLKLGATLSVHVDALPDRSFQGRVREIAAAADPATGLYRVEVAISNANQQLKTGMMGNVAVLGNQPLVRLPAVPVNALLRSPSDPNAASVFTVEGESDSTRARLRTIRLGDFGGSRMTVLAGLKGGERVVTGGKQNLIDGAPIRVTE